MLVSIMIMIAVAVLWSGVLCDVVIETRVHQKEVKRFEDTLAWFGPDLQDGGIVGVVKVSSPIKGCTSIDGPPEHVKILSDLQWFVIVERGQCNFLTKVENAFKANYSAVIIYDNTNDVIETSKLSVSDCFWWSDSKVISECAQLDQVDLGASNIPSVFIGQADGRKIIEKYTWRDKRFEVRLTDETPYISIYLIPFAIVIAICFFIMVGIMLFKCIQDRRRQRRHRLPKSSLKKIPTKKFAAGDEAHYETCCICLEDYELGDKLRVLPCDHAYHMKCIDPWLLKNKRVCPQCRKKVFATGDVLPSDSEDESEDERAPLLPRGGVNRNANSSTFIPQRENPFLLASRRIGSGDTASQVEDETEDNDEEPLIMGNRLLTEVHVEQERGVAMGSVNAEHSISVHSGGEGSQGSQFNSSTPSAAIPV